MNKKWRNKLIFTIIIAVAITASFFLGSNAKLIGKTIIEEDKKDIEPLWSTWDHMPVTYTFVEVPSKNGVYKCVDMKKELINKAFNSIEESTKNINFEEVKDNGDIEIHCLPQNPNNVGNYYYTIADSNITEEDYTIISGEINFYTDSFPSLGKSNCYDIPLHEILHLFDFYDNQNSSSIMSEVVQTKCLYKIDDWMAYQLDELYN